MSNVCRRRRARRRRCCARARGRRRGAARTRAWSSVAATSAASSAARPALAGRGSRRSTGRSRRRTRRRRARGRAADGGARTSAGTAAAACARTPPAARRAGRRRTSRTTYSGQPCRSRAGLGHSERGRAVVAAPDERGRHCRSRRARCRGSPRPPKRSISPPSASSTPGVRARVTLSPVNLVPPGGADALAQRRQVERALLPRARRASLRRRLAQKGVERGAEVGRRREVAQPERVDEDELGDAAGPVGGEARRDRAAERVTDEHGRRRAGLLDQLVQPVAGRAARRGRAPAGAGRRAREGRARRPRVRRDRAGSARHQCAALAAGPCRRTSGGAGAALEHGVSSPAAVSRPLGDRDAGEQSLGSGLRRSWCLGASSDCAAAAPRPHRRDDPTGAAWRG